MKITVKTFRLRDDPKSIPATCASCHCGVWKVYTKSGPFSIDDHQMANPLTRTHCHSSHQINEAGQDECMTEILDPWGHCPKELSESYFETRHGKAYQPDI